MRFQPCRAKEFAHRNAHFVTCWTENSRTLPPEAWVTTTFSGIEAEVDRFGDAPQDGDLRVLEEMAWRLELTRSRGNSIGSGRGRGCWWFRSVEAFGSWPKPCCSTGASAAIGSPQILLTGTALATATEKRT